MSPRAPRRGLAALLAAGPAPAQPPAPAPSPAPEVVGELRVHGNHSTPDADVLHLAGVALGDPVEPDTLDRIAARLRASGRFESVEVRKRYTSLVRREAVALILLVRERPGASDAARGGLGRALGFLARRTMFLPILDYAEGHGYSYGRPVQAGRPARRAEQRVGSVDLGRDAAGRPCPSRSGSRPACCTRCGAGRRRRARRTSTTASTTRRLSVWVGADRRLAGPLRVAARAEWSDVGFGTIAETAATYRVGGRARYPTGTRGFPAMR